MSNKKAKKKFVPLNMEVQISASRSESWADIENEAEPSEVDMNQINMLRMNLPSAPKATRGLEDLEKVPTDPPFKAHVSNISFESCEEEVISFFGELKVVDVNLVQQGGKIRGFGTVEFATREDLIEALKMKDSNMRGRKIRIELPGANDRSGRGGFEQGGFRRNYDGSDRDNARPTGQADADNDWRRTAREEPRNQPSNGRSDRGGAWGSDRYERTDRYGGSGRYNSDRGGGSRFGGENSDRGGGSRFGGDNSDRGGGSRFGGDNSDRSGGSRFGGNNSDRGGGSRFGGDNSDRGGGSRFGGDNSDRGGGSRFGGDSSDRGGGSRFGSDSSDRGGGSRFGGDSSDRGGGSRFGGDRYNDRGSERRDDQDYRRRGGEQDGGGVRREEASVQKERPRLQLQPRSQAGPSQGEKGAAPSRQSNIFGQAKPVDTLSKEMEIEERLVREREKIQQSSMDAPNEPSSGSGLPSSQIQRGSQSQWAPRHDSSDSTSGPSRQRITSGSSGTSGGSRGPAPPSGASAGTSGGSVAKRTTSRSDSTEEPTAGLQHQTSEEGDGSSTHQSVHSPPKTVVPAEVKLVPAPPPTENIWEKRKQQMQAQTVTVAKPASQTSLGDQQVPASRATAGAGASAGAAATPSGAESCSKPVNNNNNSSSVQAADQQQQQSAQPRVPQNAWAKGPPRATVSVAAATAANNEESSRPGSGGGAWRGGSRGGAGARSGGSGQRGTAQVSASASHL